jgi:hypothetical protein
MASGESRTRRRSNPYLSSFSGDAAERVTIMKWARYLGATFGTTGALRALQYYREINWISDSVRRTMTEYVRGLPIEDLDRDDGASPTLTDALNSLEGTHFQEHAKSLEFIAAIADNNIEHSLASLQLTENGALGFSNAGDDVTRGAGDLFTAPGFDGSDGSNTDPGRRNPDPDPDPNFDTGPNTPRTDPTRRKSRTGSRTGDDRERSSDDRRIGTQPSGVPDRNRRADDPDRSVEFSSKTGGSDAAGPNGHVAPARSPSDVGSRASDATAEPSETTTADPAAGVEAGTDQTSNGFETGPSGGPREPEPEPGPEPEPEPEPESETKPASPPDATDGNANTETTEPTGTGADPDEKRGEELPDEQRCIALARDGERCSRPAMDDSDYCKQHAP